MNDEAMFGLFGSEQIAGSWDRGIVDSSYLSDTLAMLSAVENSPSNATGVLSLEEEGLGFAVLESEGLAVATDIDLTL